MKRIFFLFALTVFVCLLATNVFAAAEQWVAPPLPTASVQLPALNKPLVVDGDLTEWANATSVPMRSRSCITYLAPSHEWKGPADAGIEFFWAWNTEGLCLAAIISDNELHNAFSKSENAWDVWQQDLVNINIDKRSDGADASQPSSENILSWILVPVATDQIAELLLKPEDMPKGLQFKARKTRAGYTFEILVPWKAFPNFSPSPGAKMGLQIGLVDHDSPDKNTFMPLAMYLNGIENITWTLVEKATMGADTALGPQIRFDAPAAIFDKHAATMSVELSTLISDEAASVTFTMTDSDGKQITAASVPLSVSPAPWNSSRFAQVQLPLDPAVLKYGHFYILRALLKDKNGNPLGTTTRQALYLAGVVDNAIADLKKANLPVLSQTEPFKAAAYLGAAACMEKLKRAAETGDTNWTASMARELNARFDVLADGKLDTANPGMLDLLTLAADPNAQVVVEYSNDNSAVITYLWGSVPLGFVKIDKHADNKTAAQNVLSTSDAWLIQEPWEQTTLNGLPAKMRHQSLDMASSALALLDPTKQVLLVDMKDAQAGIAVIDLEQLSWARVKAAIVLPDCPQATRDTVLDWAKTTNTPLIQFANAAQQTPVLIAGNFQSPEIVEKLGKREVYARKLTQGFTEIMVAKGDRTYTAASPSQAVAEKVLALALSGEPVKPSDTDFIRTELIKIIPAQPVSLDNESKLYCGDLHMHTFYSDGNISPIGLMLQAMYVYHDFAVMTDHNTIDGALVAQKLLKKHGFIYAQIVGEEITTWAHFNAYPVKEHIPETQPAYDFIKAAHNQGAVIHWNHPGWPPSDWATAHLGDAYFETGLDGWEHIPGGYDEKIKAGAVMPVIIGTTDTHNGTFAPPERTIIFAPSPQGEDVAEAIRCKKVVAFSNTNGRQFIGASKMLNVLHATLANGPALKEAKAQQIKEMLKNADLPGLLRDSQPKAVKP